MADIVFIGDEVTAAGFRLAGVAAFAPPGGDLARVVDHQRSDCRLMLLTAEAEAGLPARLRAELAEGVQPLVVVVPDARGAADLPDMETPVRRVLGLETGG